MMVQTAQLTGIALDYAVAIARGLEVTGWFMPGRHADRGWVDVRFAKGLASTRYDPSVEWHYGGPIIEKHSIDLIRDPNGKPVWNARNYKDFKPYGCYGNTPLEAAMRCYVFGELGSEVEIPFATETVDKV